MYHNSDGEKRNLVTSVYEMTSENNRVIINVRMVDQKRLAIFNLTPYENTDYYFTGTLNNMKDATVVQWIVLMLNVLTFGLTVFAIADCSRQNIQKKTFWMLLILGFFSVGITIYSTGFRLNLNLGWITAYSALIHCGSGTVILRLMLPVGTVIYFIRRRSLLMTDTPTAVTTEYELTRLEEESCTNQQKSQVPENGDSYSQKEET